MMFRRFVLLLSLFIFAATCEAKYKKLVPIPEPYNAVCCIWVGDDGGSGTLIAVNGDTGLVLTARHVVLRTGRLCKCIWGDKECEGRVIAVSRETDAALVVIKDPPNIKPARFAPCRRENGPFIAVGYPYYSRDWPRLHTCRFIRLTYSKLIVDVKPEHGSSGGGVFDCHGCVVATVWRYHEKNGEHASGQALETFVRKYLR